MREFLIYAIESSICLIILWGFYELALRRDTRHERNRFYLLFSLLFSSIVPLLSFRLAASDTLMPAETFAEVLLPEVRVTATEGIKGVITGYTDIILIVYIIGVAVTGARYLAVSAGIIGLITRHGVNNRVIWYEGEKESCYSAFGYIFISKGVPPSDAGRMIAHERNHISRLHHFDLFVAGLVNIIQWFNPAVYLTRKSLQALHEYEADSACIRNGEEITSYQELLVTSTLKTRVALLSDTFSNNSLLKKRLIMMTKKKSGGAASLKLIMAVPLAALLFFAFSCKQKDAAVNPQTETATASVKSALVYDTTNTAVNKEVFMVVEEMPRFAAGDTALFGFINRNIKYPAEAKENGIQGRVILRFIIDEEGNVGDITVVRSVSPLLDQAASDVMKNCPKWIPGKQGGKPVRVYFSIPINFQLN